LPAPPHSPAAAQRQQQPRWRQVWKQPGLPQS
jgi:hypothetical protein